LEGVFLFALEDTSFRDFEGTNSFVSEEIAENYMIESDIN